MFCSKCIAQAGILDVTFGSNGKVVSTFSPVNFHSISSALQSTGKIVVLGRINVSSQQMCSLVRYNSNGTIDATFGLNGVVQTSVVGKNIYVKSIVIQSDNKILVAGYLSNLNTVNNDFIVLRYSQDGLLDSTFGIGGIKVFDLGSTTDEGNSIKVQADNKIVIAGASNLKFALIRCSSNGTLDETFGIGGIVITNVGGINDRISSLNIQSDGKLVVSGYSVNNISYENFCVARYNVNGSLDNGFGNNGFSITVVEDSDYDAITSQAIQPDGKIVVSGIIGSAENVDFGIVRYNMNGFIDTSFGNNGIVITDFSNGIERPFSMLVQPDSKIVVVGQSFGETDDYLISRYNSDGSLDTIFNSSGIVIDTFGDIYNNQLNSVLIQQDGKLLVTGHMQSNNSLNLALARYNSGLTLNNNDFSSSKNEIIIYPNPSSQIINIDLSNVTEEYSNFEIYNLIGEIVVKGFIISKSINQIDIGQIAIGNYIVKMKNSINNNSVEFKIIKTN